MQTPNELKVLLDGTIAGTVHRKGDRLRFVYSDEWRKNPDAYPLSLSMPLSAKEHGHRQIGSYIWGLLPDNELTLDRWGKQFQVSPRNPFALISHVGEDCAGAVQFVREARLGPLLENEEVEVEWIDQKEISTRLRSVLDDASYGRTAGDNGQFSLAGAQPKTALLRHAGRWGIPSGRTPTTHILKPAGPDFDGIAENEHFCLSLANELGIRACGTEVVRFDDISAICVERYDRYLIAETVRGPVFARIHQEDMCQALSRLPTEKYQNEGGPSPKEIIDLIRDSSTMKVVIGRVDMSPWIADRQTFIDALILNWIIGGTDAHAKNYSFLIGGAGTAALAPLYDIVSAYGYPKLDPRKLKLAMKIGGKYLIDDIVVRHWERWAEETNIGPEEVTSRIADLLNSIPQAINKTAGEMRESGLDHPIIGLMRDTLTNRAERLNKMADKALRS